MRISPVLPNADARTPSTAARTRPRPARRAAAWMTGVGTVAACGLVLPIADADSSLSDECTQSGHVVTCTYDASGAAQTFTPAPGVSTISVTLTGASGGSGAWAGDRVGGQGGGGAVVTGTITGLDGQPLTVYVGKRGLNGTSDRTSNPGGFGFGAGGAGGGLQLVGFGGGGGGGASAIVAAGTPLAVAAGGGGGGGAGGLNGAGADGGDATAAGDSVPGGGQGGAAGTQSGPDGGAGQSTPLGGGGGGGGGGGLYGGDGGLRSTAAGMAAGGGGGGANLVPAGGSATAVDGGGDGAVVISYTVGVDAQLADLSQTVTGVGPGKSLANKVSSIQRYLTTDLSAACETLTGFINEVRAQAGKSIPKPVATSLISDAQEIRTALTC